MAYTINDDCIKCGACASECPVSCITEGDAKYEINADECIESAVTGANGVLCRCLLRRKANSE